MPNTTKASDLYRQGRFNVANITVNPDGSQTVTCDGVQAPRPYSFRVRNLNTDREEILEDQDVEVEEGP
jgi:hypothetical protein